MSIDEEEQQNDPGMQDQIEEIEQEEIPKKGKKSKKDKHSKKDKKSKRKASSGKDTNADSHMQSVMNGDLEDETSIDNRTA